MNCEQITDEDIISYKRWPIKHLSISNLDNYKDKCKRITSKFLKFCKFEKLVRITLDTDLELDPDVDPKIKEKIRLKTIKSQLIWNNFQNILLSKVLTLLDLQLLIYIFLWNLILIFEKSKVSKEMNCNFFLLISSILVRRK